MGLWVCLERLELLQKNDVSLKPEFIRQSGGHKIGFSYYYFIPLKHRLNGSPVCCGLQVQMGL